MARKDLLSEAIADAKAVKETALANAKLALEEAFTPKLQSMISAKLAEEADEEMEDEMEDSMAPEMEEELDSSEIENDDELTEEDEDEMYSEEDEEEMTEEDEEMDSEEEMTEEDEEEMTEEDEEMDEEEEIDLDEVIKTLKEMEDGSEEEVTEEEEDVEAELEEAYKTIKSLRKTINEVNLLNAKLLYTNKLFRTFDLNENQKVKVLENFDRTSSVREVKLVFSTLAENLNVAKKTKVVVREGYASKVTKLTSMTSAILLKTSVGTLIL